MATGKLTKLIEKTPHVSREKLRDYIGASSIGSDCIRQIWYEFQGAKSSPIPNKIRRTWEIGNRLEGMIIQLLRDAGLDVNESQTEYQHAEMPYFRGHCDGVIVNYNALLEIKTAKHSSFSVFVKKGVKKWFPKYYAQMQAYMGMSGIHKAYMLVLNKDTSELWDELVQFDPETYQRLSEVAQLVYETPIPPPRISGSPIWFQCKMCRFNKECHK